MKVRAWCEREKCLGFTMLTPEHPSGECHICGDPVKIAFPDAMPSKPELPACLRCGCANLYLEKAFPQGLGCLVMVTSAVLAIAFAQRTWGLSFLAIVVLDFVLYFIVPTRTICYQCSAEYYGVGRNPRHKGYDLLIAGKYADSEDVGGPAGH